jgi:hypothetical protein
VVDRGEQQGAERDAEGAEGPEDSDALPRAAGSS